MQLDKIPAEIEILKSADVWIVNEVDGGVKCTKYREMGPMTIALPFSEPPSCQIE